MVVAQVTVEELPMTAVQSALPPGADPRVHTRLLARVRAAALSGGTPPAAPRPVIGASWRRLRGSGLDPSRTPDVALLDGAALERRRGESGLAPLLPLLRERLLPVARDAGQVLVVVDAGCRVLWREGGAEVRRRADRLGFVEGSCWDEDVVGTNAIGTSVVVRAPLQVHAAEHYAEGHQPWTCAAAPLRDPVTGRVLGVVDLSGPASTVHPSTIALVDAVAALAGQELLQAHTRHVERLRTLAAPILARLTRPALVHRRAAARRLAAAPVRPGGRRPAGGAGARPRRPPPAGAGDRGQRQLDGRAEPAARRDPAGPHPAPRGALGRRARRGPLRRPDPDGHRARRGLPAAPHAGLGAADPAVPGRRGRRRRGPAAHAGRPAAPGVHRAAGRAAAARLREDAGASAPGRDGRGGGPGAPPHPRAHSVGGSSSPDSSAASASSLVRCTAPSACSGGP